MIAHIQKCTEEEMQNQLLIEGAEYEKPAFSNTATAFSDIRLFFFLYKKCLSFAIVLNSVVEPYMGPAFFNCICNSMAALHPRLSIWGTSKLVVGPDNVVGRLPKKLFAAAANCRGISGDLH